MAEVVRPLPLDAPVCGDPDDDEVLAMARTAQAVLIVSGDADLLSLQSFKGIPVVSAAQALEMVGSR